MRLSMLMFGLLVLSLGCSSCTVKTGPPIHFRLTNGYTGVFRLLLDETNGAAVTLQDGRYVYAIPVGGVLRVKSFDPFDQWHDETAAYDNGERIPIVNSTTASNTIALRGLGVHEDSGPHQPMERSMVYIIGTADQAAQAQAARTWRSSKP